jgi:chemotaxis protein CheD
MLNEPPATAASGNGVYLHPGLIFAESGPHEVTTVLGSCVSVCLWDTKLRLGGINHYLLPLWNGEGLPTPRYGNIAIQKLIEKMLFMGCKRSDLVAKVFGGGSMMTATNKMLNVGGRNAMLAESMLAEEKIRIAGYDLGGTSGRKIIFNTQNGVVKLKKLSSAADKQGVRSPLETVMLQAL